jgi:hypothetical protein
MRLSTAHPSPAAQLFLAVLNYENFKPDFHDIIDIFFSALIFLALTFAPFLAGFTDFLVAMIFPPDNFILNRANQLTDFAKIRAAIPGAETTTNCPRASAVTC